MINLADYIKDCLKNPEFKKYWEEEDFSFLEESIDIKESLSMSEALKLLNEEELNEEQKNGPKRISAGNYS